MMANFAFPARVQTEIDRENDLRSWANIGRADHQRLPLWGDPSLILRTEPEASKVSPANE